MFFSKKSVKMTLNGLETPKDCKNQFILFLFFCLHNFITFTFFLFIFGRTSYGTTVYVVLLKHSLWIRYYPGKGGDRFTEYTMNEECFSHQLKDDLSRLRHMRRFGSQESSSSQPAYVVCCSSIFPIYELRELRD